VSSGGQVGALLRLRWQMVRSGRLQVVLGFAAFAALALIALAVLTGSTAPLGRQTGDDLSASDLLGGNVDRTGEIAILIPSAMLAFILLCIIAPIVAGGGTELIPESQLVAYPVKVRTLVRLSLVLAPLNVTWYLQVLLLAAATAYAIRGPGGPGLPLIVLLTFLAACTTVGHAIGWLLVGLRRTRGGRLGTWALLGLLVLGALWVLVSDRAPELLDRAPTVRVLSAQLSAARLEHGAYLPVVAVLLAAAVGGYLAAVSAASWALRRPGDVGSDGSLSRPLPRRRAPDDDLATLLAIDRASVWRSPPLRRGLLVLAVLPVTAAVIASLPWSSIALLPPLVASGAALLFGVNALSLDGSGAMWVSTLPQDPQLVLRAKAQVVLEVIGGAVVLVLVGSALRASTRPDLVDVACAVGASVGCTAIVVATCMRLSVTRPHRAELRGPRDTPAPPGSMALYSVRLATVTTLCGLVYSLATFGRSFTIPALMTVALLSWAAVSWSRTKRLWAAPETRARVVATVSSG
jgi:hypothetical protein